MRMEEIFDRSDRQTLSSNATSSSKSKACTQNKMLYVVEKVMTFV